MQISAIQAGEQAIQHTDVLNVSVPNLMPGGGTANVVLLVLSGTTVKDPKNQDKTAMEPTALSLAYAADPEHADVYHLNKGSF